MNKIIWITAALFINSIIVFGQENTSEKPKLVVGIVVDQMRFDQLYKYEDKFSEGGFKRILKEGFNYKNAHYNHIPTVTASGHASVYTGTTPSVHGIIGNSWFDRKLNREVSNVEDSTVVIVGSQQENTRGRSPKKLMTPTISDQLRMRTNFASKVISVSLKDRGAILPGGHTANGSYWHDFQSSPGYFVSSSYYMDHLPQWVSDFNRQKKQDEYLNTNWNTLYPLETYTESGEDDSTFERTLRGKEKPVFPYNFKEIRKEYRKLKVEYQLIWVSPYGNTLVTDFAMEAVKNEKMGDDKITDMLNISYSVPDVVGHTFGLESVELQDVYLRLDRDIEKLLSFLDEEVGKGEYTLFLTADHAAIPVASYLYKHKLPTGIARINNYKDSLEKYLNTKYGENPWIQHFDGEHLYLNRELISAGKLQMEDLQKEIAAFLTDQEGVNMVVTTSDLRSQEYRKGSKEMVQNGYHPKRSGDLILVFDPGFIQSSNPELKINEVKGTTHGSGYAYDTHVPLLWFGAGIPKGESVRKVSVTDISPSLAMLLNLQLPSGSNGTPLPEILR
ncbi:alkaline phosphatase family protein [Leptobacterium flavescens]|uniref:Alkaline phosphatase family protein n=1 Tax=Leptobacterium flavescens TaxID=472055 RepID=A0A6P0UKQ3_9FLAO|nr:alkaline phosphatase PafA [Leptobacterium flavescens]NER12449.1 alkaline phosphatase family protein [Leptobacterium flavescens]